MRVAKKSVRLQIVEALGGRCMWRGGCDVVDPDMLHVDHIRGGGNAERLQLGFTKLSHKLTGRGSGSGDSKDNYYKHILNNLDSGRYQLLCANHNSKKLAIDRRCKKWEGVPPCPYAE